VLARTEGQAYVHYLHQDKRMDGYVPVGCVRLADAAQQGAAELDDELAVDAEEAAVFGDAAAGTLTEEEYDILHHKQIGARRNFDNVYFRTWEIRTWCVRPPAGLQRWLMRGRYWAPYPMADDERDKLFPTDGGDGELRKGVTSHSRTSDLLAGSLARGGVGVQRGSLWVCDGCFKYMMDAAPWDLHTVRGPPSVLRPSVLTGARAEKVRAEGAARSQGLPARRAHHLGDRRREGEGAGPRGGRARRTLMHARSCTART
jgi:histone acetyltransferase MYST1